MSKNWKTVYIVTGFTNATTVRPSRYGETETQEGAELLAEEARRSGWYSVTIQPRNVPTY